MDVGSLTSYRSTASIEVTSVARHAPTPESTTTWGWAFTIIRTPERVAQTLAIGR
jgi:hypothetical protein